MVSQFLATVLCFPCQERVAIDMRANFPLEVTMLFRSPEWKGGPLVVLHSKMGRPPSAMLGKNYMWLLPFVREFPSKAPDGQNPTNLETIGSIYFDFFEIFT